MVHLPETVLSRYVKGHVLPTADRAEEINKTLQRFMSLDKELLERIHFDDGGYFDNTAIIGDTLLLERAVQHAVGKFAGKRVTKIMTAAVDGIPLATLLAHRLGVGLLSPRSERGGSERVYRGNFRASQDCCCIESLRPRDAIKKTDCVLIVDDISTVARHSGP